MSAAELTIVGIVLCVLGVAAFAVSQALLRAWEKKVKRDMFR